jgi:hypothetical protein
VKKASLPPVNIELVDLTPRFLDFFEAAREVEDPDRRWEIWRERYGFAAVPPTPAGQEMARRLLDEAWPRYPAILAQVRAGAGAMVPGPRAILAAVAALLGLDRPLTVRVVAFVGGFENNAFATVRDGIPVVNLPIEQSAELRALVLPHEFTHAVHLMVAGLPGTWERPLAQVVVEEGLATRVTAALVPGRPDADYLTFPGRDGGDAWLAACRERERAILAGLRPFLSDADGATVARFTFGSGTTGLEREAYYAGWAVVGHLHGSGHALAELAHIPGQKLPALVDEAIGTYLGE